MKQRWLLAIQSKRIVELQNDVHGFQNNNKSKANIIDYMEEMRTQAKERGSLNYCSTMGNVVRELKLYRGDCIAFKDVDRDSFGVNTISHCSFV